MPIGPGTQYNNIFRYALKCVYLRFKAFLLYSGVNILTNNKKPLKMILKPFKSILILMYKCCIFGARQGTDTKSTQNLYKN